RPIMARWSPSPHPAAAPASGSRFRGASRRKSPRRARCRRRRPRAATDLGPDEHARGRDRRRGRAADPALRAHRARVRELARVRALERRRGRADAAEPVCRAGDIEIDFSGRLVKRAGQPVHLTPIEYRLLTLLATNAGRVLTHRQILREVWGPSHVEHEHYTRIYMGHLRRKLAADPAQPRFLLTETAVGYRLAIG